MLEQLRIDSLTFAMNKYATSGKSLRPRLDLEFGATHGARRILGQPAVNALLADASKMRMGNETEGGLVNEGC